MLAVEGMVHHGQLWCVSGILRRLWRFVKTCCMNGGGSCKARNTKTDEKTRTPRACGNIVTQTRSSGPSKHGCIAGGKNNPGGRMGEGGSKGPAAHGTPSTRTAPTPQNCQQHWKRGEEKGGQPKKEGNTGNNKKEDRAGQARQTTQEKNTEKPQSKKETSRGSPAGSKQSDWRDGALSQTEPRGTAPSGNRSRRAAPPDTKWQIPQAAKHNVKQKKSQSSKCDAFGSGRPGHHPPAWVNDAEDRTCCRLEAIRFLVLPVGKP